MSGRVTHAGATAPAGTVVAERDLHSPTAPTAPWWSASADDHRPIEVFQGQQGFLRGTMRGFARTRHLDGLGPSCRSGSHAGPTGG